MRSLAPLTLMASSRLLWPPRCSPCQQLLGTQQAKPTVSGTSWTWGMGTDPVPLLSAGEQLPGATGSCPRSNRQCPADTGMGPHVPALPQMGARQGRGSAVLTSTVCRRGRLPAPELGTRWPGLAPCKQTLFLTSSFSLIFATSSAFC